MQTTRNLAQETKTNPASNNYIDVEKSVSKWEDTEINRIETSHNLSTNIIKIFKKHGFYGYEINYQPIEGIRRDYILIQKTYEGLAQITYSHMYTDASNLVFEDLNKEENLNETVLTGIMTRSANAINTSETINYIEKKMFEIKQILKNNSIPENRIIDFISLVYARIQRPAILFNKNDTFTYKVNNLTVEETIGLLKSNFDLKTILFSLITGLSLPEAETMKEAPPEWVKALVPQELLDNKDYMISALKMNVKNAATAIRREYLAKGRKLTTLEMQKANKKAANIAFGGTRLIFSSNDYSTNGWQFTVEGKNSEISATYSYKYNSIDGKFVEKM